ncbi:hypothetical protein AVEN_126334-1 [Araneus ventricosus]|uniref:Uncharacterized protein n=1 Tax=Araneus ventricosus TaxID=182803 RepID=A0A4Y2VJU4_ARAVE|nr:hypothetical protein AVEN_126334-1 [Araneus ventricosus]
MPSYLTNENVGMDKDPAGGVRSIAVEPCQGELTATVRQKYPERFLPPKCRIVTNDRRESWRQKQILNKVQEVGIPLNKIKEAAAAREHSLRAYLQVQHWSGFAKRPLDWCWKETKHGLFSVTIHKELAAPAPLSMISLQVRKRV